MNKTENIFKYATKELSQDAFLRWLIENWNCDQDDVRLHSRHLLNELFETEIEFDKISKIESWAQFRKIDILVYFKVDEKEFVLVIEDKTHSNTHNNQLQRYKIVINEWYPNAIKRFIFYKTSLVTKDERQYVENNDWEVYEIDRIYKMFNKLTKQPVNTILQNYKQHIEFLHEEFTGELSNDISSWSMNNWVNFCSNQEFEIPGNIDFGFGNFQNKYLYFVFNVKGMWDKQPYAEIRSRDFKHNKYKNKFRIRLLPYGIPDSILEKNLDNWRTRIDLSKLFKLQNHTRQLAMNVDFEPVNSVQDLIECIEKYIHEYASIMV